MEDKVEVFKALGDINRLAILDMLSCGELCACDIMDGLELSQPTISHHMKVLQGVGLVNGVKKGRWMNYTINKEKIEEVQKFITYITNFKEDCICHRFKED
ncbi:ArsR/SmtB family transcription factor [Wansuia hejianensis]|uniref:Winged helix-turn-helix transcriptional regulator n=1 Tax=Wansuia hejianensis TaxID=2763667 RepID=A0A926F170_9FIRM|nr:winged helix-turn-helix transcriptional regulator [Wansuia hejianensis]